MLPYWVKMAASVGVGVSISSLKKVKTFNFSCMLVTDFTVMALLKYIAQL